MIQYGWDGRWNGTLQYSKPFVARMEVTPKSSESHKALQISLISLIDANCK